MLDLVLKMRPNIPIRFIRWKVETELFNNFDDVIGQWQNRYPDMTLEQVTHVRKSASDFRKDRFDAKPGRYDSYFVGIRAQESRGRRISLRHHGMRYLNTAGLLRLCPLAWWKTEDVAAYTVIHDLPLLDSYRSHGFETRTGSGIARDSHGQRELSLSILKKRDLAAFNRLLDYMPELAQWS
jgi:3'-phosphoadenosine 5'-phosphosulfate sulfotransferase (PAPS reductase)/FAD synthetase